MTNPTKVSARLKDSKGIYLKHMKNGERSTSGEIGNFSCGNEEHITKLTALKSWLLQRINKDDKKRVEILPQKDSDRGNFIIRREHFSIRRLRF